MTDATLTHLANEVRIACQRVSRRVRFESSELAPHLVSAMFNLRHGPRTPGELAEAERVSAPSMTRTVNCLVEKGFVERVEHPSDGRSKVLSLSADGGVALDRIIRERDDWMVAKLRRLTADERDLLQDAATLLNRVVEQ